MLHKNGSYPLLRNFATWMNLIRYRVGMFRILRIEPSLIRGKCKHSRIFAKITSSRMDSPLSCRRACRDSWYLAMVERRYRASYRCRSYISAGGPIARSAVRATCSCSCACRGDAWPWISSRAQPGRPPGRSALPSATAAICSAVAGSSARSPAR